MLIEIFQHVDFEGPGYILDWAACEQCQVRVHKLYESIKNIDITDSDGLIVLGGPMGVNDGDTHPWFKHEQQLIRNAIEKNIPILGICLGAQFIADALGAEVSKNPHKEIGWYPINATSEHPIVDILGSTANVLHWHGDTFDTPANCINLYASAGCKHQAFAGDNILGLQFHLEITAQSVRPLIHASTSDFADTAEFIQQPADILSNTGYFTAANEKMHRLLNAFFRPR